MNGTTNATDLVAHGWPHLAAGTLAVREVVAGRLTGSPLWRVDAGAKAFALRGWKSQELSQAQAAHRFAPQVACPPQVAVPVPCVTTDGQTLWPSDGWYWELAPWLPGAADFADNASRGKLEAASAALARLHRRAESLGCEPSCATVEQKLGALHSLAAELERGWLTGVDLAPLDGLWPADWPSVEEALARGCVLARERLTPLVGQRLRAQWVWGDARHHNVLFAGEQVTGLVDFAAVRVDTPASDLARLLGSAASDRPDWWAAGLAAYARERPLADAETRATVALHDVGTVLSLANWLRWLVIEQRTFASPDAAQQRVRHFVRRLARLLNLPGDSRVV